MGVRRPGRVLLVMQEQGLYGKSTHRTARRVVPPQLEALEREPPAPAGEQEKALGAAPKRNCRSWSMKA